MDWLTGTYFVAFVAGGGYSLLSFFLAAGDGGGHDGAGGHDAGGNAEGGHDHGGDGHHGGIGSALVAPFLNLTAWSAMAAIGGGVGYLARLQGAGAVASAAWALPAGLGAGYLVSALIRWLKRGTRELAPTETRGQLGTVLARVGEHSTGEIRYVHDGHQSTIPARSADGSPFEPGAEVVVLDVKDGIAQVATPEQVLESLSRSQEQAER